VNAKTDADAPRRSEELEEGIRLFEAALRERRISLAAGVAHPSAPSGGDALFVYEGPVAAAPPRRHFLKGLSARATRIEAQAWRVARLTAAGGPLSYIWLLIEPVIPIGFLILIYTIIGKSEIFDMPVPAFVVLGVGSWFLFRALFLRLSAGLASEAQLRRLPRISDFDAYVGRAACFAMLYFIIVSVALAALVWFGAAPPPDRPLEVLLLMAWMVIAGLFNGVSFGYLVLRFPPVSKIKGIVVRIAYLTSGAMYVTEQFPEEIKGYLLINPFLHCVQMIRDAYFSMYDTEDTSLQYILIYLMISVVVGAACLRAGERLPRAV
jgi:capsular polysaccharide transport system permease protein